MISAETPQKIKVPGHDLRLQRSHFYLRVSRAIWPSLGDDTRAPELSALSRTFPRRLKLSTGLPNQRLGIERSSLSVGRSGKPSFRNRV